MTNALSEIHASDGDTVRPADIPLAVTVAAILYDDGATQTFSPDGATTYIDRGQPTIGEWHVDAGGRFCSYWPPSYRACYDLQWLVESGRITGLRFLDGASVFVGRYQ